jgi:transcriptional regulator GlxA family with amidase domain
VALESTPETTTIVVCSGIDPRRNVPKSLVPQLRKRSRRGADIGAVCTGTHILADAGLLDGYACTIHWENLPAFEEEFPDIAVTEHLFEIDRNRFTCAGGAAAMDMMLALIAEQHGVEIAGEVADQIIHSPIRDKAEIQRPSRAARLGMRHPKLTRILSEMEQRIEEPISPSRLASEANLSTRQLERLFRRYLGRSPKRYYLELRLKTARRFLLQTDMPVMDVAIACGFSTPSHFSKCYRSYFGTTPYRERGMPEKPVPDDGSGRRVGVVN